MTVWGSSISPSAPSAPSASTTASASREIGEGLLRAAEQYEPELHALCLQEKLSGGEKQDDKDKERDKDKLSDREKLIFLGIYPHPEIYQMCGRCAIQMRDGVIDLAPLYRAGIGIPSTAVENVQSFRLEGIRRITFLENKTNYEEYLLTEQAPDELAVYHGGFLMFQRLQRIFPQLQPMRMGRQDVERYAGHGLKRPESYLEALREARNEGKFPLFHEAIDAILAHGVTIEQEAFLGQ